MPKTHLKSKDYNDVHNRRRPPTLGRILEPADWGYPQSIGLDNDAILRSNGLVEFASIPTVRMCYKHRPSLNVAKELRVRGWFKYTNTIIVSGWVFK